MANHSSTFNKEGYARPTFLVSITIEREKDTKNKLQFVCSTNYSLFGYVIYCYIPQSQPPCKSHILQSEQYIISPSSSKQSPHIAQKLQVHIEELVK